MLLNLLPLGDAALMLRPDFLPLVLLYWCIQEPRFVGVGIGLGHGPADGRRRCDGVRPARARLRVPRVRRRVLPPARAAFPLWQQAVQVAVLLVLCALLVLLVRFVGGSPLPPWSYFVSALVGALWPVVSVLLQMPQRPSRSSATL